MQGAFKQKPEKLYKVTYCNNRYSTVKLTFDGAPTKSGYLLQRSTKVQIPRDKKSCSSFASQTSTATFTFATDLKRCPRTASFKGKIRWESLGVNLVNMVRVVIFPILNPGSVSRNGWLWYRALSCCRHTPEDNSSRGFLPISYHRNFHFSLFFFVPGSRIMIQICRFSFG